jgi:hypothetical protein
MPALDQLVHYTSAVSQENAAKQAYDGLVGTGDLIRRDEPRFESGLPDAINARFVARQRPAAEFQVPAKPISQARRENE